MSIERSRDHLCKGPISKYNYILRDWGLELQYMDFEGVTVQPTTTALLHVSQVLGKRILLFLENMNIFKNTIKYSCNTLLISK